MERSRAVILPFVGDPFLLHFWLKGFKRVWYDEVDKLYIYCGSPVEEEVIEYIKELCDDPKISLTIHPEMVQHGDAINRLLDIITEEYIMLIEDDAFIFKKGAVDFYFGMVERGAVDIVASPRGSSSFEILTRGHEIWGETAKECNFWPCFFWSKKQVLLDTDRNFCAKTWQQGEWIPELQMVAPCLLAGDTFVNTSLQLRAKNYRFMLVEQYHSYNNDPESYQAKTYIFSPLCPWFHVGSLSSGISGVLMDENGRELANRTRKPPLEKTVLQNQANTLQERMEWQRRVAWWKTFIEESEPDKIKEFRDLYQKAVDRIVVYFGLHAKTIQVRQAIFKQIMGQYYD